MSKKFSEILTSFQHLQTSHHSRKIRSTQIFHDLLKHLPQVHALKQGSPSDRQLFAHIVQTVRQCQENLSQTSVWQRLFPWWNRHNTLIDHLFQEQTFAQGHIKPLPQGRIVEPSLQEIDLFRMRVIQTMQRRAQTLQPQLFEQLLIRPIDCLETAPLPSPTPRSKQLVLRQHIEPLPGETLTFTTLFDRKKPSQMASNMHVHIHSCQSGSPWPQILFGFCLPESHFIHGAFDQTRQKHAILLCELKQTTAQELLPRGSKNLIAKQLLQQIQKLLDTQPHLQTLLADTLACFTASPPLETYAQSCQRAHTLDIPITDTTRRLSVFQHLFFYHLLNHPTHLEEKAQSYFSQTLDFLQHHTCSRLFVQACELVDEAMGKETRKQVP